MPDEPWNVQEARYTARSVIDLPGAPPDCRAWGSPGIEPPLCEVLADPLVQTVMRSDGVSRAALDSVIAHAQRRLQILPRQSK